MHLVSQKMPAEVSVMCCCVADLSGADIPADGEMLGARQCTANALYTHHTVAQRPASTSMHQLDFYWEPRIQLLLNDSCAGSSFTSREYVSGAGPKLGGAVSGRRRKTTERSGARSGRSRSGNGVGVTEIGWSAERLFRRSHALLTCDLCVKF